MRFSCWKNWCGPIVVLAAGAYLAFQGLGAHYFWDDEAGTAIFARNLLRFGRLTAWDGRNLTAYRDGMELDADFINRYVPPLQFYLAAISFRLLGVNTFAGRAPFAAVGLLSLVLLYLLLRRESGGRLSFSLYGFALLTFSPSFLLYVRQCRYFSLGIFFPLLIYSAYKKYLLTGKAACLAGMTAGLIGLFFSHYLLGAAFAFALFCLHLKFYFRRRPLLPLLAAGAVFAAVVLTYLGTAGIILPSSAPAEGRKWLLDRLILLTRNFREINGYNYFPLVWMALDRSFDRFWKSRAKEWTWLIILFVVFISIFSPQPVYPAGEADVRYLAVLLPFFASLLGLIVFFLQGKCRIVSTLVLASLIFTNLPTQNLWLPIPLRFDLVDFVGEINRDYQTAYEAAVDFIRQDCGQDEVIVVVPPNMSYPLQFYTGGKVIFGGQVDRETRLPLEKVRRLNPALILEEVRPDWLLSFAWRDLTADLLNYFRGKGMAFDLFRILDVHYLGESIRPEILLHYYRPVTAFKPEEEGVLIFRRR